MASLYVEAGYYDGFTPYVHEDLYVDWPTKIIFVPRLFMTETATNVFELNLDVFRLKLRELEATEVGMPYIKTHEHNTEVTLSGVPYARIVEIINGYTVTFEDLPYRVNGIGANSNVADVVNLNQVQYSPNNSAGLITVETAGACNNVLFLN